METDIGEKVNKVLDFIDTDRLVSPDPFFRTRLLAGTEKYFSGVHKGHAIAPFHARLRPVLAVAVIILGIITGILSGSLLGKTGPQIKDRDRVARIEQFARENFISEIKGPVEEKVLTNQ